MNEFSILGLRENGSYIYRGLIDEYLVTNCIATQSVFVEFLLLYTDISISPHTSGNFRKM